MRGGWLLIIAIVVGAAFQARADSRVALVIGNSAYSAVPRLDNPVHDANIIAERLHRLGFSVTTGNDLDKAAFDEQLRAFAEKARGADAAVFYYAGHGLQAEDANWLIPVDARIASRADLRLYAVDLDYTMDMMQSRAKTSIIILDACRDNPFKEFQDSQASRGIAVRRGLAPVRSDDGEAFIAFAAQPGAAAEDGEGRDSTFSLALAEEIATPGLKITDLMERVNRRVRRATGNRQVPWYNSGLSDAFYFSPMNGAQTDKAVELALWQSVENSNDSAQYRSYLNQFPNGAFAAVARARIALLTKPGAQSGAHVSTAAPPRTQPRLVWPLEAWTVVGKEDGERMERHFRKFGSERSIFWANQDRDGYPDVSRTIVMGGMSYDLSNTKVSYETDALDGSAPAPADDFNLVAALAGKHGADWVKTYETMRGFVQNGEQRQFAGETCALYVNSALSQVECVTDDGIVLYQDNAQLNSQFAWRAIEIRRGDAGSAEDWTVPVPTGGSLAAAK